MIGTCVNTELLARYASRAASESEAQRVESHAADCGPCRLTLVASGLASAPGNREEEALIGWIASNRPVAALVADLGLRDEGHSLPSPAAAKRSTSQRLQRPLADVAQPLPLRRRQPSWSRWMAGGVAAAAAGVVLMLSLPGAKSDLADVEIGVRASEGRPAHGFGYAPFVPVRGEEVDPASDHSALEGRLVAQRTRNRAEADSQLTALYLLRGADGDQARARVVLEARSPSAARENDRGVLLLSSQLPEPALAAFEKALRTEPGMKVALFNRAVALEALGRDQEAIDAWELYLQKSGKEADGWVKEAGQRLEALRRYQ